MAAPYSEDLRIRVLAEYDKKQLAVKEISKLFNVDEKTVYRWRKHREKTGNVSPIKNFQKGHSHKITDLVEFQTFVEANPDLTTKEMAAQLGNISAITVRRTLKKIKFTFKKNNWIIKNAMK